MHSGELCLTESSTVEYWNARIEVLSLTESFDPATSVVVWHYSTCVASELACFRLHFSPLNSVVVQDGSTGAGRFVDL